MEINNIILTDEQILEIIKKFNNFEKALLSAYINGIVTKKNVTTN